MDVLLPNNEGNIFKFSFPPPPQFFRVFVSTQNAVHVAWLEDCLSSERRDEKDRKKNTFFLERGNTPVHVKNDHSQTCIEWVHLYLIVTVAILVYKTMKRRPC